MRVKKTERQTERKTMRERKQDIEIERDRQEERKQDSEIERDRQEETPGERARVKKPTRERQRGEKN